MTERSNRPSGSAVAPPPDRSAPDSGGDHRRGNAADREHSAPGWPFSRSEDPPSAAVRGLAAAVAVALTAALFGGTELLRALGFGAGATGATLLVVNGLFLAAVAAAYGRRTQGLRQRGAGRRCPGEE